jgi:hypothetical protein
MIAEVKLYYFNILGIVNIFAKIHKVLIINWLIKKRTNGNNTTTSSCKELCGLFELLNKL